MENTNRMTTEQREALKQWADYVTLQADKAELDLVRFLLTLKTNTPEVIAKLEQRIDALEKKLL